MSDLVLVEAALFQLRTAASAIEDDMFLSQIELTLSVLANAVAAAHHSLTAAAVNDIEFALNDLAAVIGELSAADAAKVSEPLTLLQDDVARLKENTSLSPAVINAIRALQAKLKTRRTAVERQTYWPEGTPPDPLPHPPEELQRDAAPLRQNLAAAGFVTPALDTFISDPQALRFHSINEIINELDVIAG